METWSIIKSSLSLRPHPEEHREAMRLEGWPECTAHPSRRALRALLRMRPPHRPKASSRRAGLDELVDDGIHQRLERGIDDIGRHADRGPMLAGLVLALDQHPRHGFGSGVEDTDAIVGQLQP